MANRVTPTPYFLSKAKRLKKKFATLDDSLLDLEQKLILNPKLGESYGANIYKIRLADPSKGKGKSGGFRVVTYLVEETKEAYEIFLITILDKSEEASIKKDLLLKIIKALGF
jgi:mRNA-degrading endonuclease RelE of RelBE toxin-antitoxin system